MQGLEGHFGVLRGLKFSGFYDVFLLTFAFLLLLQEPISLTLLSSFLPKEWENLPEGVPCPGFGTASGQFSSQLVNVQHKWDWHLGPL